MPVPVTLYDAKAQLKSDDDDQDAEIAGFVDDAAAWIERYTGHILVARDVTETFVGFERVELRAWPIKPNAVPVVTYADAAGDAVSVTPMRMSAARRPGRVVPWVGSRWPSVAGGTAVTVTVRAGYEDADPVPGNFRRAMLVLIAAYDADREGGEIMAAAEKTARALCSEYRMRRL